MTKDEALKIALEALEVANSCVDGYYIPKGKTQLPEVEEAITAIKEALAQPEPLTDEQIDEEFKLYALKFDTSSDKWLDMGADDYFKAGFKAAYGIKE